MMSSLITERKTFQDSRGYHPDLQRQSADFLSILGNQEEPLFICDPSIIANRYATLDASLREAWPNYGIGYSFKTNYLVAKTGLLKGLGALAEVVSGYEYRMARELGYAGHQIVFNGPYKTDQDLTCAIEEQAILNVNDATELHRLERLAAELGIQAEIGIRTSATVGRLGHSRFGFSLENGEADAALRKIQQSRSLVLRGVHMHLYGDTDDEELYRIAVQRIGSFFRGQHPNLLPALEYIDMGGGFPAHTPKPNSRSEWNPKEVNHYISTIADELSKSFSRDKDGPTLIVEPGRYLVCDSIVHVCRVLHCQTRDGRQQVNTNASICSLSYVNYGPQRVELFSSNLKPKTDAHIETHVFGATCRENDVIHRGKFPKVDVGDWIVHFASGSYNSTLAPTFIFEAPKLVCLPFDKPITSEFSL